MVRVSACVALLALAAPMSQAAEQSGFRQMQPQMPVGYDYSSMAELTSAARQRFQQRDDPTDPTTSTQPVAGSQPQATAPPGVSNEAGVNGGGNPGVTNAGANVGGMSPAQIDAANGVSDLTEAQKDQYKINYMHGYGMGANLTKVPNIAIQKKYHQAKSIDTPEILSERALLKAQQKRAMEYLAEEKIERDEREHAALQQVANEILAQTNREWTANQAKENALYRRNQDLQANGQVRSEYGYLNEQLKPNTVGVGKLGLGGNYTYGYNMLHTPILDISKQSKALRDQEIAYALNNTALNDQLNNTEWDTKNPVASGAAPAVSGDATAVSGAAAATTPPASMLQFSAEEKAKALAQLQALINAASAPASSTVQPRALQQQQQQQQRRVEPNDAPAAPTAPAAPAAPAATGASGTAAGAVKGTPGPGCASLTSCADCIKLSFCRWGTTGSVCKSTNDVYFKRDDTYVEMCPAAGLSEQAQISKNVFKHPHMVNVTVLPVLTPGEAALAKVAEEAAEREQRTHGLDAPGGNAAFSALQSIENRRFKMNGVAAELPPTNQKIIVSSNVYTPPKKVAMADALLEDMTQAMADANNIKNTPDLYPTALSSSVFGAAAAATPPATGAGSL